jgi:hypothetical protein
MSRAMSWGDALAVAVSNDIPALGSMTAFDWKLRDSAPSWVAPVLAAAKLLGLLSDTVALAAIAVLLKKL